MADIAHVHGLDVGMLEVAMRGRLRVVTTDRLCPRGRPWSSRTCARADAYDTRWRLPVNYLRTLEGQPERAGSTLQIGAHLPRLYVLGYGIARFSLRGEVFLELEAYRSFLDFQAKLTLFTSKGRWIAIGD